MNTKFITVAAACLGIAAAALSASPAVADPNGSPTYRALAGVGSDTTENVMNGLSEVVVIGGVKQIASFDATGGSTIKTKATDCSFTRPNGSSAGKNALRDNTGGAGCLQYARSSSGPNSTSYPTLTSIPFALDGLTYAVTANSGVPKSLTLAELQAAYRCEFMPEIQPVLPQAGSGTRTSWTNLMTNNTPANITQYLAPAGGPTNTQCITVSQEHDARTITDFQLTPFSVAKGIAMQAGLIADLRGRTVLGSFNGTAPLMLNSAQASTRTVYNVVRTAELADPTIDAVFTGADSLVCTNPATIIALGFAPVANCGDTSATG